jgi:hypothetical protein
MAKKMNRGINKKIVAILLGIFAILLKYIFSWNPLIAEVVYSRGIFIGVRYLFDYSIGLLPFSSLYLFAPLILVIIIVKIKTWLKAKKQAGERIKAGTRLAKFFLSMAAFLGVVIFLFYFLWGLNYERLPVESFLDLEVTPLDISEIKEEAFLILKKAEISRRGIDGSSNPLIDAGIIPADLTKDVRKSLVRVLKSIGYPAPGRVPGRGLWPGGALMSFGVSGFYNPLTGEANISSGLTPLEIPFSMAHEMAHGYGFTEEGTANFFGYLACIHAKSPFIQYSGYLNYLSYLVNELAKVSGKEYVKLREKIPPGIISDWAQIYKNWARYRGWLMEVGQKVNDAYLKTQGIKTGIKSYNRLILLVSAWRKSRITVF